MRPGTERLSTWPCLLAAVVVAAAACGDGATDPSIDPDAAQVVGRVEGPLPPDTALPGSYAVAVVSGDPAGGAARLAEARILGDGTYRAFNVEAGASDLQVVALVRGQEVGRALLHATTEAGATHTASPAGPEGRVEAGAWTELRRSGRAQETSAAELSLLIRADSTRAAAVVASDAVRAVAAGVADAGATLTAAFDRAGTPLDAAARRPLMVPAAVTYAERRYYGATADAAHDEFATLALDALESSGVDPADLVGATAAVATVVAGGALAAPAARLVLVAEAARLNLRVRERLAGGLGGDTGLGVVAASVEAALGGARAGLAAPDSVGAVRAGVEAARQAAAGALIEGLLAEVFVDADQGLAAELETRAMAAADAASLASRLAGTTAPGTAAAALDGYRTAVRAAVDALVAASGRGDVDASALTALFLAAAGGPHVS